MVRRFLCAVALLCASVAHAADDVEPVLKASGVRAGLCLLVGAEDVSTAKAFASVGSLYVQVLQPDAAKAAAWGADVAESELRERIGVVNRAMDPKHYGSDLFNLVAIKDGTLPLAELKRILVPGGVVALSNAPDSTAADGAKLKLAKLDGPEGWVLLRKGPGPVGEFGPSDALRWRAGSRWQRIMYNDFQSVAFGGGKLLYRETVSRLGGGSRFELVCRDAYNGRTLWKIEEPAFTSVDWRKYLRSRMGAAIGSDGKVYTGLGKDFVCLDAQTGKLLSTIAKGGRPGQVVIHKDKYLLAGGRIRDIETGKELGKYRGGRIAITGDVVYATNMGKRVAAYQIPDGKVLWRVDVTKDQPKGYPIRIFSSDTAVHITRGWPAASLSTMDLKTGKTLWVYPPPPRPKVRDVPTYVFGDKLYIAYRDKTIKEKHDFALMEVEATTGKVLRKKVYAPGRKWAGGCWRPRRAGDYVLYHHNLWLNTKTLKRTYLVMFRPKCAQGPLPANGMIYGFPGRKGGAIKGIGALAPRDIEFNQNPGGKVLKTHAKAPAALPAARESDWPMFRGNPERGNAVKASLGNVLELKWTAAVGLGKQTYGAMDSERTGLSQAVSARGLVVAADIEGQRVVALEAARGEPKWAFHVGSRVDFPPTLYQGLCLFSAKDGWAYCLDAKTGKLIYKLLIAPQERTIGGQEKLESMWPANGDVPVFDGVAYAAAGLSASVHGGIRVVAFKPRTGEVVWSRCVSGKPSINDGEMTPTLLVRAPGSNLLRMGSVAFDLKTGKRGRAHRAGGFLTTRGSFEDWLATNNRNRLSEDMGNAAIDNGRGAASGRLIAFSDSFGIGFSVPRTSKGVHHIGPLNIAAKGKDGKAKWSMKPTELNIDDFVVTADTVYCVGHYESGGKPSELRVVSLADGKILATHQIDAFPAYNGMSVAGRKLFIATREGKLICFEGKGR
jgi:outer membrane protein assembly factor BamB